ncbi:hypothetical protein VKT23_019686 [Stygiomarasmius scandens]|uniref:Crinkler effector protein N-terminal domain-containing protein n=1 Tax=Marasmiellus scandens TaxID=2682957 RepID=A0ABR1IMD8_9AGAR
MNLTLFCCLVGDSTPFSVDISNSLTVDHLKKRIRQKQFERLKDTQADELVLFKVALSSGDDLAKRVRDAIDGIFEPLDPTTEIIEIFPDEPPEETVHIAAKLPDDAREYFALQHRRVKIDDRVEILRQSMNAAFVGVSADALFNYLVECRKQYRAKDLHFYAKFTSVCNSSGTGKTKAILELTKYHVALVYINMRPSTDDKNFPLRDNGIAHLFESISMTTADDYFRSCILVFRALFQQLFIEFTQRLPDSIAHSRAHFIEMVSKWNEDFTPMVFDNQKRGDFFGAVKNLYDQMASQSRASSTILLLNDYNKLCRFLKSLCGHDRDVPTLVLALDETQELTNWRGGSKYGYSPIHVLGQVIRAYSDSDPLQYEPDVWVVFSSTNSTVTHFTASASIHASQRILNDGSLLFPPFSAFHWDIFAAPMEELSVFSVGSYEDVISFGRPLWKSVMLLYPSPSDMSRFALAKLTYQNVMGQTPSEGLLAVLSQRFALGVLFGSWESVPFISNSIASHMRILASTTDDCTWQCTTYPSEPVLSHAAAEFMHRDDLTLSSLLSLLANKILSGLIDAGEFGELIGRLLLLISRDYAAILAYNIPISGSLPDDLLPPIHRSVPFPYNPDSDTQFFPYLQPVPLLDVLNILFGPQWSSAAQNSSETEEDKKAKEKWIKSTFGRAYISCSYWTLMTEDIGPLPGSITSEDWLKAVFLRGAATQCRRDQPLIDAVIPIMYLDDKYQYVGMSSWLIQYNNKTEVTSGALSLIQVDHESIDLDTNLPYVTTCFHFGVKEQVSAHATMLSRTTSSSQALGIRVMGLSEKVFPVLKARQNVASCIVAVRDATESVRLPKESEDQALAHESLWFGKSNDHLTWGVKRKIEEMS